MLTKRIIACLDVNAGRVVKGVQFMNLRDAGDPAELAAAVRRTARQLFIPFTVGGGIRSLLDAAAVIEAGADKVSLNSAALATPELISVIAAQFGSQAVIVAIDARRTADGAYHAYTRGGRCNSSRDAIAWAKECESRGAGEILLTSMDRDGTATGFECELTRKVATAVQIPVIASGGAGGAQHFVEVFRGGCADAALAASILHYGHTTVAQIKSVLQQSGLTVRWPC